MSRCRHRRAFHVRRGPLAVCLFCGQQKPMGPANDTPVALVERRAFELASCHVHEMTIGGHQTLHEAWGWDCNKDGDTPPDDDESQAGWLAREIWLHDDSKEAT